ncbi:MAG: acetate--CoA ligase family protein [Chloroflexi bacterium]|nr:acetate--CoA ligase family protein [Chloroflexota bacterium]
MEDKIAKAAPLETAQREGRSQLTEVEAKGLVQAAGIPVVETELARSPGEAESIARKLGFPVVLKIVSHDVVHKSDAGGVRLNLANARQVREAYRHIIDSITQNHPGAGILGVSVQKMAAPGVEVIVGMSKDPQFGPVLMFGLGGVFVEVLKDVAFRVVPLEERDAAEMIREIKGFPVLQGYRGQGPADIAALEDILLKVSSLAEKFPDIKEMDLNPIFAYKDGALAVDARIILEPK